MNRAEHLQRAKDRALEYADRGDWPGAMASLIRDLGQHPETDGHAGIVPMLELSATDEFRRPGRMRKCIENFS
jgi:hypothetical protein